MKKKKIKKLKSKTFKFLDVLEKSIQETILKARLSAKIDKKKELKFYIKSQSLIVNAFKQFEKIKSSKKKFNDKNINPYILQGSSQLIQKSAFTIDDIPYIDADSILAQQIIRYNINNIIPNTFYLSRKKSYLLRKDDLMKGINIINSNPDENIIISMNLNIYGIKNFEKIEKHVLRIPSTYLRDVLFILPKSDLPIIKHKDIDQEQQKELKLGIIDNERKIYASLIDISNKKQLKQEALKTHNKDFINDAKIELSIAFITEIHWKANANVVQIKVENSLKEQGIVNELSDLEKL